VSVERFGFLCFVGFVLALGGLFGLILYLLGAAILTAMPA
jgi:hypothetical protein